MSQLREANSIVEMVELVRMAQQRVLSHPNVTPADEAAVKVCLASLPLADFYEIGADIAKATDELFEARFAGRSTTDIALDADCRLPSDICVFWAKGSKVKFKDYEEDWPFMYLAVKMEFGVTVYLVSPYFAPLFQGGYEPETREGLVGPEEGDEEDKITRVMHTLTVATICSIINQPNFVKTEKAGSRQERRAACRAGNYTADAWRRITWNVGDEIKAKLSRDEPTRCMPLHYTRGHWRRAEEGWKNTTQRKDGGWYQWIDGFWSGHPAFGVSKSYHAPKLGDAA